jgi:hypothetical protein
VHLVSVIQDQAQAEVLAGGFRKLPQASEIPASHGSGCLDFYADNAALQVFRNESTSF